MQSKSISVFLPTYNEEENIRETVTKINDYLKNRFSDYEILVINDGSKDRTADVVKETQRAIPQLKLINHETNQRYAQALRTGFANSTKDLVFYTDSDGQFDINEMDLLLPLLEKFDVVTGYRIKRQDALMRIWMGRIYNWAYRIFYWLPVRDLDCAFKLYKREVFKDMKFLPSIKNGSINAEVLLKARRKGFKIVEVPVHHLPRLKGATSNEVGGTQGRIFAFVKPRVYWEFFSDFVLIFWDLLTKW